MKKKEKVVSLLMVVSAEDISPTLPIVHCSLLENVLVHLRNDGIN